MAHEKKISLHFYTSSIEKFLQARTVFGRQGHVVKHYKSKTDPYDERYEKGTTVLLTRAIEQVRNEFGLRSVFFVEDTSLRLEALSDEQRDYPGLAVKEWFSGTNFEEIDTQLNIRGGNRAAVVKSDIALHLPTLERPIFFHGETRGAVALKPPQFLPSVQYPWLTPRTFNGWFIPEGAGRSLGEMEFEESWRHDFRIKSFLQLIERLEELNASLNLPPYSYRRVTRPLSTRQLSLISEGNPVLCVIGPKCAGKSTLGDYVVQSTDLQWFEASRIFADIIKKDPSVEESKLDALAYLRQNGMDLVGRAIASEVPNDRGYIPLVTGLRTIEELLYIQKFLKRVVVVFVDADPRIRFERHIRRARTSDIVTFKEFLEQEEQQKTYGLLRIGSEVADVVLRNDGSLEEYQGKIDHILKTYRDYIENSRIRTERAMHVEGGERVRVLRALRKIGVSATCEEISAATSEFGRPVRRYNTNRALKEAPELARRIEKKGELLRYRITETGMKYLELIDLHSQDVWDDRKMSRKYRKSNSARS